MTGDLWLPFSLICLAVGGLGFFIGYGLGFSTGREVELNDTDDDHPTGI